MTSKLIQQRLRDLRAKTRRKLFGTLAGPFVVGLIWAFVMKDLPSVRQALQPLLAFALAWSIAGVILLNKGMRSAPVPADVGVSTGLEFCRRELERQRDVVRRALIWSFGPIMLGIAALIAALSVVGTKDRALLPNGIPFLVLVATWIVAYFAIRIREQRALQHEIEELNEIDSAD